MDLTPLERPLTKAEKTQINQWRREGRFGKRTHPRLWWALSGLMSLLSIVALIAINIVRPNGIHYPWWIVIALCVAGIPMFLVTWDGLTDDEIERLALFALANGLALREKDEPPRYPGTIIDDRDASMTTPRFLGTHGYIRDVGCVITTDNRYETTSFDYAVFALTRTYPQQQIESGLEHVQVEVAGPWMFAKISAYPSISTPDFWRKVEALTRLASSLCQPTSPSSWPPRGLS